MNVRRCTWVVAIGKRANVRSLLVAFGPVRTRIVSAQLASDLDEDPFVVAKPRADAPRIIELPTTPHDVVPSSVVYLHVDFIDEAPQIVDIAWTATTLERKSTSAALPIDVLLRGGLVDDSNSFSRALSSPHVLSFWLEDYGVPVSFLSTAESEAFLATHRATTYTDPFTQQTGDIYAMRRLAVEIDQRARSFFYMLDLGAMADGLPPEWTAVVQHVNTRLALRITQRSMLGRRQAEEPRYRVPVWPRSRRFARHLHEVSIYVRTLILTHFPEHALSESRGAARTFEWALLRFATDKLSISHPDPRIHADLQSHGAPDGEGFFRLAELAFACIEHEIDSSFWFEHLNALVLAAHVYGEHGADLVRVDEARDLAGGEAPRYVRQYVYKFDENRRYPRRRLAYVCSQYGSPSPSSPSPTPGSKAWRKRVRKLENRFTSMLGQALEPGAPVEMLYRRLKRKHRAKFRHQRTGDPAAAKSLITALATAFS